MKVFSQKLYAFSCGFIQSCGLCLTFFLFICAFLGTCYSEDMTSQKVLSGWDNPLWGALGLIAAFALCAGALRLLSRFGKKVLTTARAAVYLWCLILGGALILFGKTVPAADSMSVYSAAEMLAAGDTSVIHPTGSYLSYYPQQVGLTAFFECLIRLWSLAPFSVPAYHFIKCINAALALVILLFQEKLVHLLWEDERADLIYLLLMGANLPFIMYTSFIYGEIPSFAAASIGLYFLTRLLKGDAGHVCLSFLPALAGLSFSVFLRKNNLILILAVLIVTFLQWLKDRRAVLLSFTLLCAVCCFTVLPLTVAYYELRSGNSLSSGVTAISYLAMGMQESSRGNGWYNGFNFNTYRDCNMDSEAANQVSRQAIARRLTYFKEHPGYAADFYFKKHLSQWADGTYACRQATLATFGGRSPSFISLYEGEYSRGFIGYCNNYQNALYLGTSVCFFVLRRGFKKGRLSPALWLYLGFIAVLGGFLFHIFWEANSRYIFLYSLLLQPYGAKGLKELAEKLSSKISLSR